MACWPANATGAFFIALGLYDILFGRWKDLPLHAVLGVILTGLFWVLCASFGSQISGAVLVVPAVYLMLSLIVSVDDDCGCCEEETVVINPIKPPPKCEHKPVCKRKVFRNGLWRWDT